MSVLDTLTDDGLKALLDIRAAAEALRASRDRDQYADARADLDEALDAAERAGVKS